MFLPATLMLVGSGGRASLLSTTLATGEAGSFFEVFKVQTFLL